MNRKGKVFYKDKFAGIVSERDNGYSFIYDTQYLSNLDNSPISLTMPLQEKEFFSNTMLSVFDGLIPEGWLLNVAEKNWKIDRRDRMGLLLNFCNDCIGALSVIAINEEDTNEWG